MRPLLIGFFVCINIHLGYAQWTEQDSIWLKDVLAGKDSIKLNPEFQKAIQSGSFLNPEPGKPMGKPQLAAPSNIPITKDFSEYIQQDDTTHRKVALKDLPPSVFWRHNPPYKKILPVYQSILDELKRTPSSGRTSLATFDLGRMTSRKTYVHKRNAKRNGTFPACGWSCDRHLSAGSGTADRKEGVQHGKTDEHSGSWNRGKLQLHQMSGLRKRDQSVRRESY